MGALLAWLPLIIPVIEKLYPPVLAMIQGVMHPDANKTLKELLSDIDFNSILYESRKKREAAEKAAGLPPPGTTG